MALDLKKPMGSEPEASPASEEGAGEVDAALSDAFAAVKSGDEASFKAAMRAAITAKCAEMYAEEE
jgi:hypothetical protein